MGYQALLFCPDEKNARVVTQVLNELDFAVETAVEPFAAVKKLMAQHFDALVVDCENEQNASLLFRSARNSNANQSSLAVAVVEGQAGVAKAFRIGANLVLTKPINVEQSKGTLRVARGLLRKGSDASKGIGSRPEGTISEPPVSAPVRPQPPAFTRPSGSAARPSLAPAGLGVGQQQGVNPEIAREAGLGAAQSPAQGSSTTASESHPVLQAYTAQASKAADAPVSQSVEPGGSPDAASPTPNPPFISTISRGQGAAAAAAPARELPSSLLAALEASPSASVPAPANGPSFASLDKDDDTTRSSALIKIVVVIAAIVVIAVAVYFGYKHGNKNEQPAAPEASETQTSSAPTTVAHAAIPTIPSISKPSATETGPQNAVHQNTPAAKPSPSTKNSSPEPVVEDTTVTLEKPVEPLKVKSDLAALSRARAAAQPEQPSPPPPGVLNLGANSNPEDKAVSNIVAAAPVVPKPTPDVLNISQGVTQGMITKRVQPIYPHQALTMRVQGPVQLQATISKDGNITNVKVLNGDGMLSRAAADAVRQWKYKPYYLNGEPVEIQTEITVNFKLPN